MKKGKEIGVRPIKLENKFSNRVLDAIQSETNSMLFDYCLLYMTNGMKEYLLQRLSEFGERLQEIPSNPRKEELLTKMREIYRELKGYYSDDDRETIRRMNGFLVSEFLREKNDGLTEEVAVKWLRRIKTLSNLMPIERNLLGVHKECLEYFSIGE